MRPESPKILAIDPGTTASGYAVWNGERVLEHGVIGNETRLEAIPRLLAAGCAVLALEMIGHYCLGMPAGKTTFITCLWIGRFTQRWIDECIRCPHTQEKVFHILRPSIKTHICGTPRAKDANVRQAIHDRLGVPGTKKAPGVTYGATSHRFKGWLSVCTLGTCCRLARYKAASSCPKRHRFTQVLSARSVTAQYGERTPQATHERNCSTL